MSMLLISEKQRQVSHFPWQIYIFLGNKKINVTTYEARDILIRYVKIQNLKLEIIRFQNFHINEARNKIINLFKEFLIIFLIPRLYFITFLKWCSLF